MIFRSWAAACLPEFGLFLERMKRNTKLVLNATVALVEKLACSAQLDQLMMLCKSTAHSRVVTSGTQEELEA